MALISVGVWVLMYALLFFRFEKIKRNETPSNHHDLASFGGESGEIRKRRNEIIQ